MQYRNILLQYCFVGIERYKRHCGHNKCERPKWLR